MYLRSGPKGVKKFHSHLAATDYSFTQTLKTPGLYKIICTMTKKGSRLEFNFSGTSENARGLINCSYAGLQAACLTATYINLCWDIPWNRGVRDCMTIVSDVGTVNNCAYPAPCAMAT